MDNEAPESESETGGGRAGAFLRGAALGAVVVAAGAVAVSLTAPVPTDSGPTDPAPGAAVTIQDGPAPIDRASGREDSAVPADTPPAAGLLESGNRAAQGADVDIATEPAADAAPDAAAPEVEVDDPASVEIRQTGTGPEVVSAGPPASAPSRAGPEPAIAGAPEPLAEPGADAAPVPAGTRPQPLVEGPALAVNARDAGVPAGEPLLSVVLIGAGRLSAERLATLTMPTAVTIRADAPGAAETGAAARAAGHEVLADLSLPQGAAPGQPEDVAARAAAVLDMAVGATATGGVTDADRQASVMDELAAHGFAWIDPGGIGTPAEEIADRLDMAYAGTDETVPDDASPEETYQLIDRAARRAQQWGSAVIMLPASEQALDTLIRWGIENPQDIWFAPISAVIEKRRADSAGGEAFE